MHDPQRDVMTRKVTWLGERPTMGAHLRNSPGKRGIDRGHGGMFALIGPHGRTVEHGELRLIAAPAAIDTGMPSITGRSAGEGRQRLGLPQ